jgi:hypothetical protein
MQTTKAKVAELETTVSTMNDSLNAIMAALGIKPSAVTIVEEPEIPLPAVMAAVKADVAKKAAAFSIEVVKADNPNKNAPKQPALPQQVAETFTKERLTIRAQIKPYTSEKDGKVSEYMEFFFNGKPEEKLRKEMSANGMRYRVKGNKWSGKIGDKLTVEWAQQFGQNITSKKFFVVATKKATQAKSA